jgi:hypothetical protein
MGCTFRGFYQELSVSFKLYITLIRIIIYELSKLRCAKEREKKNEIHNLRERYFCVVLFDKRRFRQAFLLRERIILPDPPGFRAFSADFSYVLEADCPS